MTFTDLTRGRYNPDGKFNEWTPLGLILLRSQLEAGAVRMELALEQKTDAPESVRKNTEELVETLREAVLALHDLETQRNVANHNSVMEKAAHARTAATLEAVKTRSEQLSTEGERLRAAVADLMRNA